MRVLNNLKIALLLACLLFAGCNGPVPFKIWNKSVLSPAYWNSATTEQQVKAARQGIEKALLANELELAQKHIYGSHLKQVTKSRLADLSTTVINRLLVAAESAKRSKLIEEAGWKFMLAKQIYPSDNAPIDLTLEEIDKNIQECADTLMDDGLIAYRSGDLEDAINIWAKIDRFMPEHPSSHIARNTARQQLHNLEKLTSKSIMAR